MIARPKVATLGAMIDKYNGIGPSFDFLRLALSCVIFYAHTNFALRPSTILGPEINSIPTLTLSEFTSKLYDLQYATLAQRAYTLYVPIFFALSGFLVAGSAFRLKSVKPFLMARGLRIFPALTCEVFLSAIILGAFFSVLPWWTYVTDPGFRQYFGNILGIVHFYLPGVFLSNPQTGLVNVNLWTLPPEFYCYLALSLIMALGLLDRGRLLVGLFVVASLILIVGSIGFGLTTSTGLHTTPDLVFHFMVGLMFYKLKDRIPYHPVLFLASGFTVIALLPFPQFRIVAAFPLVYCTTYVGFLNFLAMPFMKGRDYSYGIYLYGFPITQAFIAVFPSISRPALAVFGLSATIAVAMTSWHFIEKPCLRLKNTKLLSFARK